MGFLVPDLEAALGAAARAGAPTWSPPVTLDLPEIGARRAALVTTPGSGALIQLVATA
jgi:hypothetical protein